MGNRLWLCQFLARSSPLGICWVIVNLPSPRVGLCSDRSVWERAIIKGNVIFQILKDIHLFLFILNFLTAPDTKHIKSELSPDGPFE